MRAWPYHPGMEEELAELLAEDPARDELAVALAEGEAAGIGVVDLYALEAEDPERRELLEILREGPRSDPAWCEFVQIILCEGPRSDPASRRS